MKTQNIIALPVHEKNVPAWKPALTLSLQAWRYCFSLTLYENSMPTANTQLSTYAAANSVPTPRGASA